MRATGIALITALIASSLAAGVVIALIVTFLTAYNSQESSQTACDRWEQGSPADRVEIAREALLDSYPPDCVARCAAELGEAYRRDYLRHYGLAWCAQGRTGLKAALRRAACDLCAPYCALEEHETCAPVLRFEQPLED